MSFRIWSYLHQQGVDTVAINVNYFADGTRRLSVLILYMVSRKLNSFTLPNITFYNNCLYKLGVVVAQGLQNPR